MSDLAERYARLLRGYPRRFREEWGDDLLADLLDTSSPGQRWPDGAQAVSLLWGGARARLAVWRGLWPTRVRRDATRCAGEVSLVLLAVLGAVVFTRWAISATGGEGAPASLFSRRDGLMAAVAASAAAGWPLAALLLASARARAARAVAVVASMTSVAVLRADWAAGRGRPALDLIGALAGLAVLAGGLLFAEAGEDGMRRRTARAWTWITEGAVTLGLVAALSGRSLGAPGPWLGSGAETGVRSTAISGVLVGAWLLAAVVALMLARRNALLISAVAEFSLVPTLAAVGYVANSAQRTGRPLLDLLGGRAPLLVGATALLIVVVVSAARAVQRDATRRMA